MIPKFRIWDKANNVWATDFTISLDGDLLCDNGTTLFIKENFEIVFWTQWNDSFGNPIFVGDIVEHQRDSVYSYGVITYRLPYKTVECEWIGGCDGSESMMYELFNPGFEPPKADETIKVMGNTYQNTDMIEKILMRESDEEYHPNPALRKIELEIEDLQEEIADLNQKKEELISHAI